MFPGHLLLKDVKSVAKSFCLKGNEEIYKKSNKKFVPGQTQCVSLKLQSYKFIPSGLATSSCSDFCHVLLLHIYVLLNKISTTKQTPLLKSKLLFLKQFKKIFCVWHLWQKKMKQRINFN